MTPYQQSFDLTSPEGIEFTAECTITPGDKTSEHTPGTGDECKVHKTTAHDPAQQEELNEEIANGYKVETAVEEMLAEDGRDGPDEDDDYEDRREAGC